MPWVAPTMQDAWARIENKNFRVDEELRTDIPNTLANSSIYIGLCGVGTPVDEPSWVILKTDFNADGFPFRKQVGINIAWSGRVAGPWQ